VEIEFPIVRTVMGRAGTGGRGSGAEGDPGAPLGGSRRAAEGFGGLRRTRGAPEVAGDAGGKLVARCRCQGESRAAIACGARTPRDWDAATWAREAFLATPTTIPLIWGQQLGKLEAICVFSSSSPFSNEPGNY
jgi:hypothetical protein